ncbi:MAG TPA: fibronectin type III domain-containing protein, partial [Thermoanaerobaculia bacterium]|nr:fibronectin type III domain-containing protein [Thermoanaerobaculia bacterium]
PRVPAAPAGLAARALGPSAVELTWRDLSDNEEEFRIEQKAGKTWRQVLVLPPGATSARLAGLRPDSTATYRVSARNAAGAAPGPPVTVRTPRK